MPNSSYNMSTYTEFKSNTPYEITMVLDTDEKWVQMWVNDIYLEIPDYSSLEPEGMEYAELGSDSSILRFQSSLSGNDDNVFQMDNISVKGISTASGGTITSGIENGATGIAPADAAVYSVMSTVDWKNVGNMPVTASKSLNGGVWQTAAIEIQKKSLREIVVVFQEGELLANSQYKIHIGSTQALDGKALPEKEFTFSTLRAQVQKPAITLASPLDGQTLAGNRIEVLAEECSNNL